MLKLACFGSGSAMKRNRTGTPFSCSAGQFVGKLLLSGKRRRRNQLGLNRFDAFAVRSRLHPCRRRNSRRFSVSTREPVGRRRAAFSRMSRAIFWLRSVEFVEAAPSRLIRRDGIVRAPCSARVLIEVRARTDVGIHRIEIDSGLGRGWEEVWANCRKAGKREREGGHGENSKSHIAIYVETLFHIGRTAPACRPARMSSRPSRRRSRGSLAD